MDCVFGLHTMLFEKMVRMDASPKRYTENSFDHLNRSSRPEYEKMRVLIEEWCGHVPDSERKELIRRFASGDDNAFHSAFLELYVHELLLVTGHIVTFHPEVSDVSKRPDFLATAADGSETIVECTVATEISSIDRAAQARI